MISKEVVKTDAGRVTAGLPALDSSARFLHDSDLVHKDFTEKLDAERERGNAAFELDEDARGHIYTPDQVIAKLLKLNQNLWFERSGSFPSQLMCCLRVPVTEDHPKGLKYISGFPADVPVAENTRPCRKTRVTYTRDGIRKKVKDPCNDPQCKSCGGLRQVRGWFWTCRSLLVEGLTTRTRVELIFKPSMTENKQRFMNGN